MTLERAGIRFDDVTLLNFMKRFSNLPYRFLRWVLKIRPSLGSRWKDGKLNPHGGSILWDIPWRPPARDRFECPLRNEEKLQSPLCSGHRVRAGAGGAMLIKNTNIPN